MGRLLYVVFDDSNLFGSRKPRSTIILHGSITQKTALNTIEFVFEGWTKGEFRLFLFPISSYCDVGK
jgi:hypothetical protein